MSGKLPSEDLVKIGFLRKPHGLGGFLKMTCLTDFAAERFQPGSVCMVLKEDNPVFSETIAECKVQGNDFLIRFEGRESVESAEEFRNSYVCVEFGDRLSLDKGDFYPDQLMGLEVYTFAGTSLGHVIHVDEIPANPVIEVRAEKSSESILIPFVKALVKGVDVQRGKIELAEEFSLNVIE